MVHRSVGIITALVPYIGYEGATELAKEVMKSGKTVPEIISEKGIFTPEEMKKVLCPKTMTKPGNPRVKKISIA
jgi:aspartate ammonia-lyase